VCEEGKAATIIMSKTQIKHNMKIEGGFLPLITGLAAKALLILAGTIIPALATHALRRLASTGVNKLLGFGSQKRRKRLQDDT